MINPDTGVKKESKDRLFQCPPLPLIYLQRTTEGPSPDSGAWTQLARSLASSCSISFPLRGHDPRTPKWQNHGAEFSDEAIPASSAWPAAVSLPTPSGRQLMGCGCCSWRDPP